MRAKFRTPSKAFLCLLTAAGVVAFSSSDYPPRFLTHFSDEIRVGFNGLARTSRAFLTIASNAVNYKYTLHGLSEDTDEYRRALSEVHLQSAKRLLKLCEANKGFYVKAGQFVAALRQVPKEYTSTLSSLQDQAIPCQFRAIKEVLTESLKKEFTDIFISFDEQPIAAASVAQVHHAVLKNHEEVAVKVQYPGLEQLMKLDITTMSFLSKAVAWLFPEYRFGWILSAFKEAIAMELDFIQEAKNSERTAKNFENDKRVKVPRVFWDLTSSKVLTMQFCTGHKVDDLEFLMKAGIDPIKVAQTLSEVFASMIFIHGFVHGDPHPGNILVSLSGPQDFILVLLDHGLYRTLDEEFRLNFCQLWKALVLMDSNKIQYLGERFGIGNYFRYLPLIFTERIIDSKSALRKQMSSEERLIVRQELKSLKIEDVSSFMESLPSDFLTILRTDGLLRSIHHKLGAPRYVRLLAYSKYAIYGLSASRKSSVLTLKVAVSRLKSNFNYLQLMCLLGLFELVCWMEEVKHLFIKNFKNLLVAAQHFIICCIRPQIG
ncbi:hypothetical protein Nepgr_017349 [Nepenthes gracilis]|uniref:ABC1 atypical kinase-like domain-containing protein n=1 Tax=Nepenthes gracilis TaxID=150966 RepID=A0AAD3XSE2_NEPGR|nr:hypothetical protein Nepgr_017349 [Nepenthes gracilis]